MKRLGSQPAVLARGTTMTIKLRLVLLIATGLLTALIMSLAGYLGNTRMADAVQDNDVSMTVLRNHMEADMMHDALRADVLSAMLVGLGKSTSTPAEVNSSIKEHAEHFREVLAENLKLPLDASIKASLEKIKPSLDTYISAGRAHRRAGPGESRGRTRGAADLQCRVQPVGRTNGGVERTDRKQYPTHQHRYPANHQ